jgi:hypothetical protein
VVDKPKPRRNARTIAVKTIDYFPYYQLARAHLACGETDAARDYLSQSRQRGVAPAETLDELERRLDEADRAAASGAEPVDTTELARLASDVQSTIQRANAASKRIADHRDEPHLTTFFRDRRDRLDSANEDLDTAQSELNAATLSRDREAIETARRTAAGALDVLTGLEAELERVPTPRPTPVPTAGPPARPAESRAAPPPTATRAAPMPSPRPTSLPVPSRDSGRQAPLRDVPESLRRAAIDFLNAGYDTVVRELAPDDYSDNAQRAAAHLLRAASSFALYCLEGRTDDDRLEQARRDIARTRELDPSLRPDPRFFSPEFAALFP